MFCKKCGQQLSDNALFCKHCGEKTSKAAQSTAAVHTSAPVAKTTETTSQAPKKSKTGIIILCIVLSVALLGAAAFAAVHFLGQNEEYNENKTEESAKPKPVSPSPIPTATPAPDANVVPAINTYIESAQGHNSISVAVLDNKTNKTYFSSMSDAAYSAWGFYLPIYLASGDLPSGMDAATRAQIMSSDAGACNSAGNKVIQQLGGPSGVSSFLASRYGAKVTTYGRYFADVNATADNYTNAQEAVQFLKVLNSKGEYAKLSYNMGSFGISSPAGANVYAQIGTENKAKMQNLNLFAIVKGANSDYCIAVLTQHGAGKNNLISNVLNVVHQEMERISA